MFNVGDYYKVKDENYTPGIKIQDFSTKGRVSRIKGKTTNRIHHLISDLETNLFYLLDFEDKVTDIKEHYPLLDLEEVVSDLSNIRLDKFKDKKTGEQYIFTTTFVVRLKGISEEKYLALSVRNETELYRDLLLEKLEVERRYWQTKEINWTIITNKDIPMAKVNNIKWLYMGDVDIEYEKERYVKEVILSKIAKKKYSVKELLSNTDNELLLPIGTSLVVFKKMIINEEILADLYKPIDIGLSSDNFHVRYQEVTKNVL
ncbi:TnsA endonuclease C-terminal domain-containing protein [Clostridium sp.]|uniref:TnsA endonuclease C-terminal domain-containing protein n=1 Tax=Clostridium sp. TaxID=1506 RepID=UPI002FC8AB71